MAWVAVDQDGDEYIYSKEPRRRTNRTYWIVEGNGANMIQLPSGTIEKLTGRTITWDDEPVELTENLPIDKR